MSLIPAPFVSDVQASQFASHVVAADPAVVAFQGNMLWRNRVTTVEYDAWANEPAIEFDYLKIGQPKQNTRRTARARASKLAHATHAS